ncbi:MAG: Fpg/Nei family DNA glycosylase [Planctomycetota bacterium]
MPELPDIALYLACLRPRVVGRPLQSVRLVSPFVLRTVEPELAEAEGQKVEDLRRIGKRIVLVFPEQLYLVIHLMKAGRLRWEPPEKKVRGKLPLASFAFADGTLWLTEAGTKKRAWIRMVRGEDALADLDPGGLEVLDADLSAFAEALRRENHTLKRALTDARILSGIGNAYSDEILHAAGLSPVQRSQNLPDEEIARLFEATRVTLTLWIERLREEAGGGWPKKVTAFHDGMAVHGKYGQPCPVCGKPVQRIRYAESETNYCAECQTGGRLLADRGLSRLLGKDWPRRLEDLEA